MQYTDDSIFSGRVQFFGLCDKLGYFPGKTLFPINGGSQRIRGTDIRSYKDGSFQNGLGSDDKAIFCQNRGILLKEGNQIGIILVILRQKGEVSDSIG